MIHHVSIYPNSVNQHDNETSVWDTFMEASYLNKRDIAFEIRYPLINEFMTLNVGNNHFSPNYEKLMVEMKEYQTFLAGTCYEIKSNLLMNPPNFVQITVTFNDSLHEIDLPKVHFLMISIITFYYFSSHLLV